MLSATPPRGVEVDIELLLYPSLRTLCIFRGPHWILQSPLSNGSIPNSRVNSWDWEKTVTIVSKSTLAEWAAIPGVLWGHPFVVVLKDI